MGERRMKNHIRYSNTVLEVSRKHNQNDTADRNNKINGAEGDKHDEGNNDGNNNGNNKDDGK